MAITALRDKLGENRRAWQGLAPRGYPLSACRASFSRGSASLSATGTLRYASPRSFLVAIHALRCTLVDAALPQVVNWRGEDFNSAGAA